MKDYMKKELCDRGIDISDDEYYRKEEFRKLENDYIYGKITMPKAWWIEKHIVGQERLKKIYGIYALGVEYSFSEKELKNSVWMKNLADKYNIKKTDAGEGGRTVKDIEQYFYRKESDRKKKGEGREEVGLVERLKRLGFDIDKFDDPKAKEERIKLLYFLFGFEFDYKVKISPFLSNPSFENIDNSIAGDRTRNGKLMAYLKNNIMKGIDENYVIELKDVLNQITDRWEDQICYMIYVALVMKDKDMLADIHTDMQWILSMVQKEEQESEASLIYEDSLLESFYLRLSLHEMIGREKELIDISEATYKDEVEINEFQREMLKKYMTETVCICRTENAEYVEVLEYIKAHRKELAQCVFGKEKVDGNNYRKFDKAADSITPFLDFYRNNTMACMANDVPVVLLISHMQEYIFENEKVNAKFYRHETKDKVTYRTELDNGNDALRRSQYAWLEKVNRRYFTNLEMKDVNIEVREIEKCFDKLLENVYGSNSLEELKYRAWWLLSYIEAFVGRRYIVEKYSDFLIDFLKARSFELWCGDRRMIYQFMNYLDEIHFYCFMDEISKYIADSAEDNRYICLYDIEQDGLYTDEDLEAFLEIEISIKDRKIDVINGGVRFKELLP